MLRRPVRRRIDEIVRTRGAIRLILDRDVQRVGRERSMYRRPAAPSERLLRISPVGISDFPILLGLRRSAPFFVQLSKVLDNLIDLGMFGPEKFSPYT